MDKIINLARAAEGEIVSCAGPDCGVCAFLETLVNGYNFVLGVSFAVAVFILVIAGFAYIFSVGKKSVLARSKQFLRFGVL